MKLVFIILIASLLSTSSSASNTTINISWLKRNFGNLSYEEMLQVTKSPQNICSEVNAHVKYKSDTLDIKKEPKQTWNDKYGDCEDFAQLIQSICEMKNIPSNIYIFYVQEKNNMTAHAVVIGNNWMASNGKYQPIKSLDDASWKIARSLKWNKTNKTNKTVNYKLWNEWKKQSLYHI